MSRNQQGVVLFLTLLLCLFFFGSAPPWLWHQEESAGIDRIWESDRTAFRGVWVEVGAPFVNRGVYSIEKGRPVRDALAKAGEFQKIAAMNPESLAAKVERNGRSAPLLNRATVARVSRS